jgi:hypothetical protein
MAYEEHKVSLVLGEAEHHADCLRFGRKNTEKQSNQLDICPCCAEVKPEPYPLMIATEKLDASGSVVPQYFHLVKFLILTALIIAALTLVCQYTLVQSYCQDNLSLTFLGWEVYPLLCPPRNSKIILSPIVTPVVILIVYLLYFVHHGNALTFIDSIEDKATQVEDYSLMMFNMREAQISEDYIQNYLDNILLANGYKERVEIAKVSKVTADCRTVLLEKEEQYLTKTVQHIQQYLKRHLGDINQTIDYAMKKCKEVEEKLEKVKKHKEEHLKELATDKSFGEHNIALVTLQRKSQATKVIRCSTSNLLGSQWSFLGRMRFFSSDNDHPIEKAYAPEDFSWENVGVSTKKLLKSMRKSIVSTFCAVIAANLVQLSMMAFKTYLGKKQSDGELIWYAWFLIKVIDAAASILTAGTNLGLILSLAILSILEKHLSKSQWVLSFTRKLVFFQFLNSTLVAIAINISPDFFGGNPNLEEYIFNQLLTNIFLGPFMHLFDPFFIMRILRRRSAVSKIKNNEFPDLNQKDLNQLHEPNGAGINGRYSAVVRTFFVSCFFFEIVPSCMFVTVIYLCVQFWVDKYMLLRLYQKSPKLDPQLGLRIGELAESSMFLLALGRIYSRIQTGKEVHSSDYLCFIISCALCITPLLGYAIKLHMMRKQKKQDLQKSAKGTVVKDQDEEVLGRKTRNMTNVNDDSVISDYNSKTSGLNEKLIEGISDSSEEVTYEQLYLDFPTE